MGKEQFVKGLDLYHRRYRHGNATRDQWVQAMEEASGQQFAPMAEGWLKQTGFPTLAVQPTYDSDRHVMTLHLRQDGDRPEKTWIFPVRIALVDSSGTDMTEVLHRVEKKEEILELVAPEPPAFISINRGYSFYGKVRYDVPLEELYLQAEHDSDLINRFIAFMTIMDREKIRLLSDPSLEPDPACTGLWFRLLSDRDLMMQAGGQFLTVFESVPDKKYAHRYADLYEVRERILRSIPAGNKAGLLEIYADVNVPGRRRDSLHQELLDIKRRQIKNTALSVLSRLDTPDIHQLLREQFGSASCATDTLVAFSLLMESSAADRTGILDRFERESKTNPVSWENLLAVIAGNSSRDVMGLITRVEQSDAFRIEQANDQRALYGRFALNRKKSIQTDEGRAFLQKTLLKLAAINEHSTVSMLRVFGAIDVMEEADQVPLVGILARLLRDLDQEKTPSVYNTVRRILLGAPHAVQHYEQKEGPVPGLTT
jgi:aminopeptidase N